MLRRTLLLLAALAALSGCGRDNPHFLPQQEADALNARIDEASELAGAGKCDRALASLSDAEDQVAGLSDDVSKRLKSNLREWIAHLRRTLPDVCEDAEPEKTPEPSPSPEESPTAAPVVTAAPTTAPTAAPSPQATPSPPQEQPTVEPGGGASVDPDGNP